MHVLDHCATSQMTDDVIYLTQFYIMYINYRATSQSIETWQAISFTENAPTGVWL